jgi:hypothetical protein
MIISTYVTQLIVKLTPNQQSQPQKYRPNKQRDKEEQQLVSSRIENKK